MKKLNKTFPPVCVQTGVGGGPCAGHAPGASSQVPGCRAPGQRYLRVSCKSPCVAGVGVCVRLGGDSAGFIARVWSGSDARRMRSGPGWGVDPGAIPSESPRCGARQSGRAAAELRTKRVPHGSPRCAGRVAHPPSQTYSGCPKPGDSPINFDDDTLFLSVS